MTAAHTPHSEEYFIRGLHAIVEMIDQLIATRSMDDFFRLAVTLPREKLGVERAGLSILHGDVLHGTYGTTMTGDLVDEHQIRYPLDDDTGWESHPTQELRTGSRWFVREDSNHIDWTHPDKPISGKRGWVATTPLKDAGELLGFFSNDTALTNTPLSENLQELLVVYGSLLASVLHQKQTQKDLEVQLSRNEFILKEIGDGLLIVDEHWQIEDANQSMIHMLECKRNDLVHTRLHDHVDKACLKQDFFTGNEMPARLPSRFEIQFIRKDHSLIASEITCVPFNELGRRQIFMFCRDITDRKRLEQARAHLAQRLLEVQELERKEISAMLHDQLGQTLTLIRLELQSIMPRDDDSKKHLHNCTSHVISLLEVVRGMARSLRPSILDDHPIELAFQDLLDEFQRSSSLDIEFVHQTDRGPALSAQIETDLYRILQESMQNIVRHAQASRVTVTYINSSDGLHLMVEDNGIGMPQGEPRTSSGIGLLGIRERLTRIDGTMKVSSHRDQGTTVEFYIPNHVIGN